MEVNGITLLLVEDDDVDAEAIQRAFRQQRIANPFVLARDGVEALAMMRDPAALKYPYVVLLDINLPRMNGLELLEAVRDDPALARTIVFVLTTSDRDEDKVAAYDHHVAGYILKSRAGADFLEVVQMLKVYWRLVEFPPATGLPATGLPALQQP